MVFQRERGRPDEILVLVQNRQSVRVDFYGQKDRGYSLERFGMAHDLVVGRQLLQHQAVVIGAGDQDVVGQIGQVEHVLRLSTLQLLLLEHLLVELHVLLLDAGCLAALNILPRITDRLVRRLVTHQRTDAHCALPIRLRYLESTAISRSLVLERTRCWTCRRTTDRDVSPTTAWPREGGWRRVTWRARREGESEGEKFDGPLSLFLPSVVDCVQVRYIFISLHFYVIPPHRLLRRPNGRVKARISSLAEEEEVCSTGPSLRNLEIIFQNLGNICWILIKLLNINSCHSVCIVYCYNIILNNNSY